MTHPTRWTRAARLGGALGLAALLLPACKKDGAETEAPDGGGEVVKQDVEDPDEAAQMIIESLSHADIKEILAIAGEPLDEELTPEAFEDYVKVIQWLGDVKDLHEDANYDSDAAKQRDYYIEFEKGEVHLRVTIIPGVGLIGFKFEGDDFIRAEHGALEDNYAQFKVYDFRFLDDHGDKNPEGDRVHTGRIDYLLIVGGLEAKTGEHHINVEKIVLDADGKPIYDEPIEFDLQFEENAEGIPRGMVKGFVQVDNPGRYTIELVVRDNVSGQEIDYKHDFEVAG